MKFPEQFYSKLIIRQRVQTVGVPEEFHYDLGCLILRLTARYNRELTKHEEFYADKYIAQCK